jgi:lipoprotein-releasing system ATP-binding protein
MTECLLEVEGVTKSYDSGRIQALRGIDLQVHAGEFLAVCGPSGSGKSTLLHLLGGLDRPTKGDIRFKGISLSGKFNMDSYRSKEIGFVFQAFHLISTLTALENVQLPMMEGSLGWRERQRRAELLLGQMGLDHRMYQYPNQLSTGERQRVAIARSLTNDPEILLADEPTGNLDSENSAKIMQMLSELRASRKMTLIVVTHEAEVAQAAHRRVYIRDGLIGCP